MCETCGRQFKRKDKLREHMKRLHGKERMEQPGLGANVVEDQQTPPTTKFTPKVGIAGRSPAPGLGANVVEDQ